MVDGPEDEMIDGRKLGNVVGWLEVMKEGTTDGLYDGVLEGIEFGDLDG